MVDKLRVVQRLELLSTFLRQLRQLAQISREEFLANPIAGGAAESYLRRSLEAVFDIGRHLLAKTGHADMAAEYKAIARGLADKRFVRPELGPILTKMAGYRNRMVHFYHEIATEELYAILQSELDDIDEYIREIRDSLLRL